ncbi:MAG: hypothetical protein V4628_10230 [Pseudomonadota bacterium]
MANDKQKNQDGIERNDDRTPGQDTFPGNPNKQKQDSPRQQQSESGNKPDKPHLDEGRSVTDRTVRRSVIDKSHEDDDDDIDALKG